MDMKKHAISLNERKDLVVTGVSNVDNYDDVEITLQTSMGLLVIKGEGLNINVLNVDDGTLEVAGTVNQLIYSESKLAKKSKNILQKLLK